MLNRVDLIGNVGRLEVTSKGELKIANFSIATSEKYNGTEKTTWHNCVAFGKLADVIEKYSGKGQKVFVSGKLDTQTYEKNGEKRTSTKIVVHEFTMLSRVDQKQAEQAPADDFNAPF